MKKLLFLLSGVVAALAVAACGSSSVHEKIVPDDLCVRFNVVCNDPTGLVTCDPVDGECKCGGALGNGLACGKDQVCKLAPGAASPSCVSTACENVTCERYEVCDPLDGLCKCGGVECAPGATCVDGTCQETTPCDNVTCREGETCDPADGVCKCGDDVCSVGQSCRTDAGVSQCIGRLCVGNHCPAGSECSPVDGLCHCGGQDGPVCSAGQSCEVETATAAVCSGNDICAGVVCQGGTTCSPLDGQCRCGGYDTAAPICGEGQTCDQARRQCMGGDLCAEVTCAPGSNTSCDEEEGICKCGGTGGVVCNEAEGCVAGLGAPTCVTKCNPLQPSVERDVCGQTASQLKGCYYSAADKMAFCTNAGGSSDGGDCQSLDDCASGHHCVQTSNGGTCRPYCDTTKAPGSSGGCYGDNRVCVALAGAGEVIPNIGVCMTLSN
jgi:hypothetical protein